MTGVNLGDRTRSFFGALALLARNITAHHTMLVASGVAFSCVLGLLPAILAVVAVYGLVASPTDVESNLEPLVDALPTDAGELLIDQIENVTAISSTEITVGLAIGLLGVAWAVSSAINSMVMAIRIAHEMPSPHNWLQGPSLRPEARRGGGAGDRGDDLARGGTPGDPGQHQPGGGDRLGPHDRPLAARRDDLRHRAGHPLPGRARSSPRWPPHASDDVVRFLDATGALYLDTQESRGLVPTDHPSVVGAVRAAAMSQADLVITLGRKLDYQLAYGSPAVFRDAKFLRIADTASELIDNRRGAPEILASVGLALSAIADALGNDKGEIDETWSEGLRAKHRERIEKGATTPARKTGSDGKIHPMAIFEALKEHTTPTRSASPMAATCSASPASGWRRVPTWTQAPLAAWASGFPMRPRPRSPIRTAKSCASPATAPMGSTQWKSTPPSAMARRSS